MSSHHFALFVLLAITIAGNVDCNMIKVIIETGDQQFEPANATIRMTVFGRFCVDSFTFVMDKPKRTTAFTTEYSFNCLIPKFMKTSFRWNPLPPLSNSQDEFFYIRSIQFVPLYSGEQRTVLFVPSDKDEVKLAQDERYEFTKMTLN